MVGQMSLPELRRGGVPCNADVVRKPFRWCYSDRHRFFYYVRYVEGTVDIVFTTNTDGNVLGFRPVGSGRGGS